MHHTLLHKMHRLLWKAAYILRSYNLQAWLSKMLGTTQQVLFEQEENGLYAGHAMNYVKVYVQAADLHNEIRAVRVTELYRDGVLGELE